VKIDSHPFPAKLTYRMIKWQLPLGLVVGMGIGALAVVLIEPLQPSHSKLAQAQSTLGEKTGEIEGLKIQLAKAVEDHKAGEEKQAGLQGKITELESKLKKENPPESRMSSMAAMASGFMKQMSDAKLVGLKSRLNLTPAQEEELRRFLEEESKHQQEMAEGFLSGKKPNAEEIKQWIAQHGTLDGKLKQLLTPEQQGLYKTYKEEEEAQQKGTMAQHSMNKIATMFPLNEDQKDKVYGIFYDEAEFKPKIENTDPAQITAEYNRQRYENTKGKLKEVLTPEQLALWSKSEEERIKNEQEMIKKFMPK